MEDSNIEIIEPLESALINKCIGFIGAGNIAQAFAKFMINHRNVETKMMYVSAATIRQFKPWEDLGITRTTNRKVVRNCDYIILAVAPFLFRDAIANASIPDNDEKGELSRKIFISVIEGITVKCLTENLKSITHDLAVFRVVLNLPVEVTAGCSVYTMGEHITEKECEMVETILSEAGICKQVDESVIDIHSILIGSGTCFAFMAIEALIHSAVNKDIPRESAIECVTKMIIKPAEMVLKFTEWDMTYLREELFCCSRGPTVAGLKALEIASVKATFIKALEAGCTHLQEKANQNN